MGAPLKTARCPFTGRTGWPNVLRYRDHLGRLWLTPPRGLWQLVIYDVPGYEQLAASGAIYNPPHTRATLTAVDNRVAPGA